MTTNDPQIKTLAIVLVILVLASTAINIYLLKSVSDTSAQATSDSLAELKAEIAQLNENQQDLLAREVFSTTGVASLVEERIAETVIVELKEQLSQLTEDQGELLARETFSLKELSSLLETSLTDVGIAELKAELKSELEELSKLQSEVLAKETLSSTELSTLLDEYFSKLDLTELSEKLTNEFSEVKQSQQDVLAELLTHETEIPTTTDDQQVQIILEDLQAQLNALHRTQQELLKQGEQILQVLDLNEADEPQALPVTAKVQSKAEDLVTITMRISRGDTLWSIASHFTENPSSETLTWLAELNGITNPKGLQIGSSLTIPLIDSPQGYLLAKN